MIGALALLCATSLASQIHLESASLDRVLERTTTILVVHPAQPALEERTRSAEEGGPCFYRVQRHVVDVIVLDGGTGLEPGAVLEIASGNLNTTCAMQQTMADGMPVPSPILDGYQPSRHPPADGRRIVYLRQGPFDELAYAMTNAWDPESELEGLMAKLAARETED